MNEINEWKSIGPQQNNINIFYDRKKKSDIFEELNPISPFISIEEWMDSIEIILEEYKRNLDWYQPPHFTSEPTKEELEYEESIIRIIKLKSEKRKELAKKIYYLMTGEKI